MKLLTPTILIIASIIVFFWFISPTYNTIGMLQANASQYQTALKSAQSAAANRDNLTSRLNSISSDTLDRLQTALPDSVDPIHLFIDINALAQKYGTSLSNISVPVAQSQVSASTGQSGPSSLITAVPLTFTVSLTYNNFLSFLQDLEKSLRLMDISSIQFTPTDGAIYDYTITVKTYALK